MAIVQHRAEQRRLCRHRAASLRLRQREIETIFKLGCSRATTVRLLAAEIVIILAASALLTGLLLVLVIQFDDSLVRSLFIR